jgi:hypothetical protein
VDSLKDSLERLVGVLSENAELRRENTGLKRENERLWKENDRLDELLDYYMEERSGVMAVGEQRNSVLMHYNELQSRSAEVLEAMAVAMAMNFEQRVADAVAKAGLRAKLSPNEAGRCSKALPEK